MNKMLDFIFKVAQSAQDNRTAFGTIMSVGLGASSFLSLGQLGAARFGIMPMILSPHSKLSTIESVKAWDFFFSKATVPVVASILLSSVSYLAASTQVPRTTTLQGQGDATRKMLYLTALVAILPLPFTAIICEAM